MLLVAPDDGAGAQAAELASALVRDGGVLTVAAAVAPGADLDDELLGTDADCDRIQRLVAHASGAVGRDVEVRVRTGEGRDVQVLPRIALEDRPQVIVLGCARRRPGPLWRELRRSGPAPVVVVDVSASRSV